MLGWKLVKNHDFYSLWIFVYIFELSCEGIKSTVFTQNCPGISKNSCETKTVLTGLHEDMD